MQYKVDIGKSNKFHGLTRDYFEEGEEVIFYVPFVTDVNTYVTSKDVRIESLHNDPAGDKYRFIMPAHDVSVDISRRGGMTCMSNNGTPEMMMGTKMMMMMNAQQSSTTPAEPTETKFCPECGAKIAKAAKYCGNCGVIHKLM